MFSSKSSFCREHLLVSYRKIIFYNIVVIQFKLYILHLMMVISFLLTDVQAGKGGELTRDETTIITGALELTEKTARDAMTPISETFSVDINAKLDRYNVNIGASEHD